MIPRPAMSSLIPLTLLSLGASASVIPNDLSFQSASLDYLSDSLEQAKSTLQSGFQSLDSKLVGLENGLFGGLEDFEKDGGKFVEETAEMIERMEQAGRDSLLQTGKNILKSGRKLSWDNFMTFSHPSFPSHRLRVKKHLPSSSASTLGGGLDNANGSICDPDVVQYSGYLDISEEKHLFFWFFESRDQPEEDPLVLWLNGGPGCSSSTGLLMELGPCRITKEGQDVEVNPHSWSQKANVVFLDQPVNVGYSFSSSSAPNTSPLAADDIYAFLQLFYQNIGYHSNDFNIAAESYGGHYAPNLANKIWSENKKVANTNTEGKVVIPLKSVMIGNGLTDPLIQFPSIPDYACPPSNYSIFDESTCTSLKNKVPLCERLDKACYDSGSRFSCVPAGMYCWGLSGPIASSGRNPYDTRKSCDRNANPLCYDEMQWSETWLNKPEIKKTLGAPEEVDFQSCNNNINAAFQMTGDAMHNSAALIPPMIEDGIRFLIYAGEWDFMCSWMGNHDWVMALETKFKDELNAASEAPSHIDGVQKGWVKTGGKGAGEFTFVKVFDSGHMVPYDSPEFALKMIQRWLANKPISD